MSENNVNGIIGADVANTTGIVGATVGIGQYIVNDYVITIAEAEGDYGYTMTITRGTDTQTVTLYGLTPEQYNAMLGYLEAAQSASEDAAAYMEAAINAANTANTQAGRATQASNTAHSYATQAQTAKQGAETAKTDAQTARTQAQGYRQAAEAAATRAESAATRAETAAGEITGMTAEAETLTPGSPATASFLDGVLSLGIPAGVPGADGDDGNGIVSIVKSGTSGNVDTYTITYTNGTTSTFTVRNGVDGAVTSVAGKTGAVTLDAGDVSFDDQQAYNDGTVGAGLTNLLSQMGAKASTDMALGAYPTDTVSGDVASFSDGADSIPVKDLVIGIEPVQAAGTPTPESPLPISGWTGANINANGTTIPITFTAEAGTVYGGTLDVTTGVLTVTWGEIDLSKLVWTYNTSLIANVPVFVTGNIPSRKSGSMNMLCSVYKSYSGLRPNIPDKAVTSYNATNSSAIVIRDDAYSDVASFRNAIAGADFVCELAVPQTYQLTPVEVLTLLGANTIYADTGDTTVTYRADSTLYADKRSNATRGIIAGIEPTMTASKAYTVGQLLIVGDTLYKVAASIASGATLTPGTNVNPTTVAEQLILLANA